MLPFDPPWRFDPFFNPVAVSWGGVYVLVQFFGSEADDTPHSVDFSFPSGGKIVFQRSQSLGSPGGRYYEGIFLIKVGAIAAEGDTETTAFIAKLSGCTREEGTGPAERIKVLSVSAHDGGPGYITLPPDNIDPYGVGVAYFYAMLNGERSDGSPISYALNAYVEVFGSGHANVDDVLVRGTRLSSSIFSYSDTKTYRVTSKALAEWAYNNITTDTVNLPGFANIPDGQPFTSKWPLSFQAYVYAPSGAWVTEGVTDRYYPIRRKEQLTNTNQLDGVWNCVSVAHNIDEELGDGSIPFVLRRAKYQPTDDDGEYLTLELFPGKPGQSTFYKVGTFRKTLNGNYFVQPAWSNLPMGSAPPQQSKASFIDTGNNPNIP